MASFSGWMDTVTDCWIQLGLEINGQPLRTMQHMWDRKMGANRKANSIHYIILLHLAAVWLWMLTNNEQIFLWQNTGWSVLRFSLRAISMLPRIIHVCCSTAVLNFREQKSSIYLSFLHSSVILFLLFVCLDLQYWVVLVFIAKTTCSMQRRNQENHYRLFYSLSY